MNWQEIVDQVFEQFVPDRALSARLRAEIPGWVTPRAPRPRTLNFRAVQETTPGSKLSGLFGEFWPSYRAWYLRDGDNARPTLAEARDALQRYMPELLPIWQRLIVACKADEIAATMLTMFDPPAIVRGCSQVVLPGDPVLLRNYDFDAKLFDAVVLCTDFEGRGVIGTADQLWGLVDGINDAGLAASLTFGGRPEVGRGFGIPIVMRYLLQTCTRVSAAVQALRRIPIHLSYNVTMVDDEGDHATVFVGPDREPEVVADRATTNHQDRVFWPAHAEWTRSVERLEALESIVAAPPPGAEAVAAAMMRPPLRSMDYDGGFGTLYTAVYRPKSGSVSYHWPKSTWRFSFVDFREGEHVVDLGRMPSDHEPQAPRLGRREILEEVAAGKMMPDVAMNLLDEQP
ncbi:MAG: C45 family autoproteolytic acyltransferase/hydrolase [Actinomycetota bacterium]|nr:C45 family autoproteolytic acyltransferase/hydrolase [Actinomycetota bacterium]